MNSPSVEVVMGLVSGMDSETGRTAPWCGEGARTGVKWPGTFPTTWLLLLGCKWQEVSIAMQGGPQLGANWEANWGVLWAQKWRLQLSIFKYMYEDVVCCQGHLGGIYRFCFLAFFLLILTLIFCPYNSTAIHKLIFGVLCQKILLLPETDNRDNSHRHWCGYIVVQTLNC